MHFKVIFISLVTICHYKKTSHNYCVPHAVHFIHITDLFCNGRSVPLNLPHLFLSRPLSRMYILILLLIYGQYFSNVSVPVTVATSHFYLSFLILWYSIISTLTSGLAVPPSESLHSSLCNDLQHLAHTQCVSSPISHPHLDLTIKKKINILNPSFTVS